MKPPLLLYLAPLYMASRLEAHDVTDLQMRALEKEAAKTSILEYNTDKVQDIVATISQIKSICDCKVKHLPKVHGLILTYKSANHLPAKTFLSVEGIEVAEEDKSIGLPDDPVPDESENPIQLSPTEGQVTNDPLFDKLWAFQDLANEADINWQEGREKYQNDSQSSNTTVIVAVIDTGIDYNHPDLKDEMWKNPDEIAGNGIDDDQNGYIDDVFGVNLLSGSRGDPMDKNGHGTHCAGTIAASINNNKGIVGVAGIAPYKVKLMAVRAIPGSWSYALTGLDYALSKGAIISSNSYGGNGGVNINNLFKKALADNPQHLFVSAAGNANRKVVSSYAPAAAEAPNHICVAASTMRDIRASFSNYGIPFVNVFAPGEQIMSTCCSSCSICSRSSYKYLRGTSMACPHVSGLAAVLMSMRNFTNAADVKQIIEQNVQVKSQYQGVVTSGGLIDVNMTICSLMSGRYCKDTGCKANGGTCSPKPIPGHACALNNGQCASASADYSCYCCKPKNEANCIDQNGYCKRYQGNGQGACVNITSMPFEQMEAAYDLSSASPSYNRYCVTSDAKSNKDCCLCLRKRVQPCKDNGCMSKGGLCVDIKNSYLSTSRFPRNVVNISKPIVGQNGTSLCTNPNGPEKKMCCQCYEIKG